MSDIVQKLWGFCHTLRHDGIDYGDYIEQITYLLFLKMADERAVEVPKGCAWPTIRAMGASPRARAPDSFISTTAAAPSEIEEALAAVTVPSFLKAGFRPGILSICAFKGCSSLSTTTTRLPFTTWSTIVSLKSALLARSPALGMMNVRPT